MTEQLSFIKNTVNLENVKESICSNFMLLAINNKDKQVILRDIENNLFRVISSCTSTIHEDSEWELIELQHTEISDVACMMNTKSGLSFYPNGEIIEGNHSIQVKYVNKLWRTLDFNKLEHKHKWIKDLSM